MTERLDLGDAARRDARCSRRPARAPPSAARGARVPAVAATTRSSRCPPPPAHTACPNPYLREWVEQHRTTDDDRRDPGPFASDSQAGKTSLVYKAHGYPTKVPHEAIMRLILHYTKPGDIVLDGFCGTGMTGVAAQMCGTAGAELRTTIELEMGKVEWGARRAVLQDLGPAPPSSRLA